jgi:release factor glutamine methyltransferase
MFDPLPASLLGEVDLLVVNPPYVAETEYQGLPDDVKREPKVALVSGASGLEAIQRVGASASQWLRPGGVVVCEIGERQGTSAPGSFHDLPTVVRKDLSGRDRYVIAVKP